jgi:hypothetical protein
MKKRYHIWVDLDVEHGAAAKSVLEFDGVDYELTASPVNKNLERLRKLYEGEGFSTFGGEPSISLGPRPGGAACDKCGRPF